MSLPHACECRICGRGMSPILAQPMPLGHEWNYAVAVVDSEVGFGPFIDRDHAKMWAVLNLRSVGFKILRLTNLVSELIRQPPSSNSGAQRGK